MKFKSILTTVCIFIFTFALCYAGTVKPTGSGKYTVFPYKTAWPLYFDTEKGEIGIYTDANRFVLHGHYLYLFDTNYPSMGNYISHTGGKHVSMADINDSNVGTNQIKDLSVSLGDMNSNSVNSGKIVDTSILSADMNNTVIKVDTVELTNAQLKALQSAPVTLVSAKGTHSIIEVIKCVLVYDHNTTAFAADTNTVVVKYVNGSGTVATSTVTITAWLANSADTVAELIPVGVTAAASLLENRPVVLCSNTSSPITGNGKGRAIIVWRVIPSGL